MLKFLSEPLNMILSIVDVMTKDTLKIDAVRIGFLVLYLGVVIGLCSLLFPMCLALLERLLRREVHTH